MNAETDKSMYFVKTQLGPEESTGGRVDFNVKNASGRWAFKNTLTSHAFNFDVKEISD